MLDAALDLYPELPASYRQRALSDLNRLISSAECSKVRQLKVVERLAATGKDAEWADVLLRRTEHRLALLRQSRNSLG